MTSGAVRRLKIEVPKDKSQPLKVQSIAAVDADKDGFSPPANCDDGDAKRHPGAAEVCTGGVDDDCDGKVDGADPWCDGAAPTCPDADKDGFADCLVAGCSAKGVKCGDCDDADGAVRPDAKEGPGIEQSCFDGADARCRTPGDPGAPPPTCRSVATNGHANEKRRLSPRAKPP